MSRPQREGLFGPPSIHRERASYDTPPYWGQAPPPGRYPQPPPPSQRIPPPQRPQHGRSLHRVPPPPDYLRQHAPPQQRPTQYHQSQHHQYAGRQWRDPAEQQYSAPPNYPHHMYSRRDIPRDDYGRPHPPKEMEYQSPPLTHRPPPQQVPRTPPPIPPPIQFRPNSKPDTGSATTKKKSGRSPSPKDSRKKKKGDALSLLAKVSTAMADPEEDKKKAMSEGSTADDLAQMTSPPRRSGESPPTMWTTPKQQHRDHNSRQITPTSTDQHAHRTGPPLPPPRGYYQQSYSRYAPLSYASAQSSTPHYSGVDSPTAIISERGSFEQDDRTAPYGSPPRPYAEEHSHYAPYTYVQQPRMEDKTILRKKFSWKHYPELERFLIANRDEYLRHSALNYTAEQKQYNNWLTERLLEVAARHHYIFDPEDFNFVAVRDRIRCYYKSYVQTARKRGLPLITQNSSNKQAKTVSKAEMES